MKTDEARGAPGAPEGGRPTLRPRWWREVLYMAAFYGVYTAVRDTQGSAGGGTNGTSAVVAFHHARQVIHAERDLLLYHERQIQHFFLAHMGSLTRPFFQFWDIWYGSAHFVVTIGVAIWLFRRDPVRWTVMRNILAVTTALALIGFASYPLMPPRLLDFPFPNIGAHAPYGFVDTLVRYGGSWSFDSHTMQKVSNQFAAMPSLHIGWSVWCTLAVYPSCKRWWTKALAVAYPIVTLFAIVVTANHYFLDAAGGLLILALAALIATPLTRRVHAWHARRVGAALTPA
ncbi:MAG TPA: phosphatase PAP2 family protein [Acidimicrobiales bacterium]|nr:phosphatase PAP2 family protein [Acidimicrobiales bacterium]